MVRPTRAHVHRRRGAALCAASGLLLVALAPDVAAATSAFTMSSSAITTPHALASDTSRSVYWTANPTGKAVYAVTATGTLAGQVPLGFSTTDIEALAVHQGRVYLGDIGDPNENRAKITVFRLASPTYGQAGGYRAWDFTYPDGQHDAATLLVSSKGNIYVVTRGASAAIYRAPASPTASGTNSLTKVAAAPDWVTDGTFVDDSVVALRTYTSVVMLDAYSWKTTAQAALPAQADGQALTTALGSTSVLMAGSDKTVTPVQVPTSLASVAAAPSAAPGTATASASADATTNASASTAKKRTGTLVALLAAGALALVAAAVVAIKR